MHEWNEYRISIGWTSISIECKNEEDACECISIDNWNYVVIIYTQQKEIHNSNKDKE